MGWRRCRCRRSSRAEEAGGSGAARQGTAAQCAQHQQTEQQAVWWPARVACLELWRGAPHGQLKHELLHLLRQQGDSAAKQGRHSRHSREEDVGALRRKPVAFHGAIRCRMCQEQQAVHAAPEARPNDDIPGGVRCDKGVAVAVTPHPSACRAGGEQQHDDKHMRVRKGGGGGSHGRTQRSNANAQLQGSPSRSY